jgi:hypothetical protein
MIVVTVNTAIILRRIKYAELKAGVRIILKLNVLIVADVSEFGITAQFENDPGWINVNILVCRAAREENKRYQYVQQFTQEWVWLVRKAQARKECMHYI